MPFSLQPFYRFLLVIGCILLVIGLIFFLFSLAYPFLIGFVLAFLINPIVSFQERYFRFNRGFAVLICLFLLLILVSGFMTFLIAEIIAGSAYLASAIPIHLITMKESTEHLFFTRVFPFVEQLMALFATLDESQQDTVLSTVKSFTNQFTGTVSQTIQSILHGLSHFLLSLPNLATVFVFSLLSTFFISKDWNTLTALFRKLLPTSVATHIHTALLDMKQALFDYMKGQFLLISMTCFIVLVGFLFLDIKYPITTALIIAIVDLIPYLGTGFIFIPWIIYSFMSAQNHLATGIAILYCIVLIQRQLFEPRVLSASLGIAPLAMLVALFVGFQLFQFVGLLIGPAALIFLRTIYRTKVLEDIWAYIKNQKK
ncbi:sporulation integral membrane protein YtvI [Bacillus solitudinis]|uniref:sporulation integral membrane protein YtvI n=1 Tax=Bacillus solitudinis TaxID=2014074 RepID=UPI000C23F2D5|nr:sporulation integral membrane protein YtvI [Bacillus solitudinis]